MLKAFSTILTSRIRNYSSMAKNVIGLCQMRSTEDKNFNREQVAKLFERSSGNAKMLFFPECCDFVGRDAEETISMSESLDGETVSFYKQMCRENKLWASFGGIHETIPGTSKIYNCHIIINDEGNIVASYRKLHLFDVDTPEFKFRESKVVEGGKAISFPLESPVGKIGLQICYDIRFPEGALWLKSRGASIITFPSAFALTTGKAHWEILNRCRAIENQCFIISAAQQGKHNEKRSSYGSAMAVDPWGKVLAQCTEELEVQFAEIDLDKVAKVERNMPCSDHRRSDVYSIDFRTNFQLDDDKEPFIFEKYPIDRRTVFYETEHSIAFTNIRCVVPGHVLVASKRKVARVEEMTKSEAKELFSTACEIAKAIDKFHGAKSTTITVQNGEYAGQTVKHVHIHVMPRKPNDFEHNDEIYVRLNEHDKKDNQENRRPLEEMIEEAQIYRNLLKAQ